MLKVLSEEESIEYEKTKSETINSWFNSLSLKEKEILYEQYMSIFKQMSCSHDFYHVPLYGKLTRQCRHCDYWTYDDNII